jgi:hypothetical protein
MNLKKQFINAFLEEVVRLNGTEFEEIGRYVMELITNQELIQKGHNPHGKPVGYTVDYEQLDRITLVGQSGTDSDYFSSGDKPLKDIAGSLKNCPNCKTIYLFSNQRASGGQLDDVKNAAKKIYPKVKVRVYDAEAIAEKVYEKIYCEYRVKKILQYLPKSYQYYQMYAHSNSLPNLPSDYVYRTEEKDVCQLLKKEDFVQIYGLSGIGKTLLTIAVAQKLFKSYNMVIWLDGETLDTNNLKCIHLNVMDQNASLETMLSKFNCLVIIDNLNKDIVRVKDQFDSFNKKGSKCIVTSLQKNLNNDTSYQLSVMHPEIALNLLNKGTKKPTEEQASAIVSRINGYPLLLNLAKSSVDADEFSWDEIINLSELADFEDDHTGLSIARRIIGRYVDKYPSLFNVLVKLDSTRVCRSFIRELNKVHYNQLVKSSVLDESELYYCHIHSIVLESIKTLVKGGDNNTILSHLSTYLDNHLLMRDAELYTLMSAHLQKIEALLDGLAPEDILKHKLVLACIYEQNTVIEHDKYYLLANQLQLSGCTCLVDLLLEAEKREILINKKRDSDHGEEAKYAIAYFESLLKDITDEKLKSVCLHHIAKWKAYENRDQAITIYQEALKYDSKSYRTRLQLARIYNSKGEYDKVYEQTDCILAEASGEGNVPLSVIMSVYDLLAKGKHSDKLDEYLQNYMNLLTNTIEASASCHNTQVYYVMSNLSGTLAYNHGDIFNTMCRLLPSVVDIHRDEKVSYQYANILTRLIQYVPKDDETRESIYQRALAILTSIQLKDDYYRRTLMNLYLSHGDGYEVLEVADQCEQQDNIYIKQTKAKAYCCLGLYDDALRCIDYSIENEGDCFKGHKAAFRHDKAAILYGMNDRKCLKLIDEAIGMQPNMNSIRDWSAEKEEWCKVFENKEAES